MITEFKLPEVGEGIESGVIVDLLVSVGDKVEVDTPLLELETDKAVVEIPSNLVGVITDIYIKENAEVKIGQAIMAIDASAVEEKTAKSTPNNPITEKPKTIAPPTPSLDSNAVGTKVENKTTIPAAPSVRRMARETGIDLNQVAGSGILGRISAEDIHLLTEVDTRTYNASKVSPKLPDFGKWGGVNIQTMSGIRKATAKQMQLSWNEIPHVTHFDKCDITELEKLRKTYAKRVDQAGGGKLTPTAIIAKIVASALDLEIFRDFNASIDATKQEVIHKNYVHLGIAVDTPRGLIVPKIRDANKKSIIQLSKDLNELADKARAGKTSLEEMQGGSFTITNLGGIGGHGFTPIVNHPEVAILGISRATWEPRLQESQEFVPRLMMPLALSYDHRLIDGAAAARFTRWICEALEQPFLVLLEG